MQIDDLHITLFFIISMGLPGYLGPAWHLEFLQTIVSERKEGPTGPSRLFGIGGKEQLNRSRHPQHQASLTLLVESVRMISLVEAQVLLPRPSAVFWSTPRSGQESHLKN